MLKLKDRHIQIGKTLAFHTNSNDEWYILPTIVAHSMDWERIFDHKKEVTYGIAVKWLRGWFGITKTCKKR